MTKQKILDKAIIALIKQGKPSIQEDNPTFCLYRGPNNTKCAIGHLLSDWAYKKKMEGLPVEDIVELLPRKLKEDVGFLSHVQGAHDCTAGADDFISAMIAYVRDIAKDYNLSLKNINQALIDHGYEPCLN